MFNWYASFGIDSSHVPLFGRFPRDYISNNEYTEARENSSVKGKFTVIDVEHFDPNNIDPALVVPIDLENLPQYSALLIDKRAPTSSLDAFEGYFQQKLECLNRGPQRGSYRWISPTQECFTYGEVFKPAVEAGVKIRFPLEKKFLPPFIGTRIGIRTTQVSNLRDARFIFELGLGAW